MNLNDRWENFFYIKMYLTPVVGLLNLSWSDIVFPNILSLLTVKVYLCISIVYMYNVYIWRTNWHNWRTNLLTSDHHTDGFTDWFIDWHADWHLTDILTDSLTDTLTSTLPDKLSQHSDLLTHWRLTLLLINWLTIFWIVATIYW